MDTVGTRELAYFVAVAEELHFGRAATRLAMAQPPLSRAIALLERRMGVMLLRRTSRKVELTEAGEVFLREARKALLAADAAVRRAQRAAQPDARLVVVTKPGGDAGLLPAILDAYRQTADAVVVEVVVCGIGEQEPALRDGRADIGLLHPPHDDLAGFQTRDLVSQSQVLVVPRNHRLARRAGVSLADLEGLPKPRWPGTPEGSGAGPWIRDGAQLMELIALGQVVGVLPRSAADHLRRGLIAVPVIDALPSTVVLAWPQATESPALTSFVQVATTIPRDALDHQQTA